MNKIKTLLLTTLTAVACVGGLAACSSNIDTINKETIIIGVTDYNPMDYLVDDEWTGFDADLATAVFNDLGYKVEFEEIEWEKKNLTLASGKIDCIWNGMTINDELKENLALTDPYCTNYQYGVVRVGDAVNYKSQADLVGKTVVCEGGSAANDILETIDCNVDPKASQVLALFDVMSNNNTDIAIVDSLMAGSLTAEGTDFYGKLETVDLGFEKEYFAVGFRKNDTSLRDKVNSKISEFYDNGKINEIAKKYNIESSLIK